MKLIICSLFVLALVSTGFSAPVEKNDELPPIGGFLNPVHPVILNLAKETLLKVQDNLKSAGHVEEALHLNKVLEKTEKVLEKAGQGVLQPEQFDLEDHLDEIYNALEKYKEYLPIDNSVVLAVSSNNEVQEHLRKQLHALLVRLENKQMPPVPNPNMIIQIIQQLLQMMQAKKAKWYMKKQQMLMIIQQIIDYITGMIPTLPPPPPPPGLESIINGNNALKGLKAPISNSDADLIRSLLDSLLVDLEKIEQGLRKDYKLYDAGKVFLHIQIIKTVKSTTHGGNTNRKAVNYALNKGVEYVKKYAKYLSPENRLTMFSSFDGEDLVNSSDDEDNEVNGDEPVIEDRPPAGEEEPLDDEPADEDNEVNEDEPPVVVEEPLDDGEPVDDEDEHPDLQPGDLDKDDELNDDLNEDDNVDEDNLPDQTEEEDNLSTLEKIRKQLNDLRDRFRANRRSFRVRIVDAYIRVVDGLIDRLKKHQLDNNRFHDFVQRVKAMLEKYTDHDKEEPKAFAAISIALPDNELESRFDEEDLPNEKQEEENMSVLEQFRQQLSELRDKLKANHSKFKVRVVEAYQKVLNALIERLKNHKLDNGRFNDFVKRTRDLLEKLAKRDH